MHEQTGRLFLCSRCQAQVLVCSQCDRGQRYCDSGCADITRLSRQREAGNRYQQSRAGRHKHAARMHQWRKRRAAAAKIVTHHGSQGPLPMLYYRATNHSRQSRRIHSPYHHAVQKLPRPLRSAPPPTPTARCLHRFGVATGVSPPVRRWCAKAFCVTAVGGVMVVTPELRAQILRL